MSRQLVNRSPDLKRLEEEGYAITIDVAASLLLMKVAYVAPDKTVAYGMLASELSTSGEQTTAPGTHVVNFIGAKPGEHPHDHEGRRLDELINQPNSIPLGGGYVASCSFSHKPAQGYPDYFEKMTTYADMLLAYAQVIDPEATNKTFPPIVPDEDESVFRYLDSATSRSRIGAVVDKIKLNKVVIVGLGGTGSYILDCLAKTPIRHIHLYDKDVMLTHNAFRAPGAATLEELNARPSKVEYHRRKYDAMHPNIVAHPDHVGPHNIEQLRDADYVFLAIDAGEGKKFIVEKLCQFGVPFIDTGMGVYQKDDSLGGMIRVTAARAGHTDHLQHLSYADEEDDEYDQNIQLAELNMQNAAQAVIKFKKHFGFYADFERELTSVYTIDGNHMLNEDQAP